MSTGTSNIGTSIIGDLGVALARFKLGKLGLIFREKPTLDYGIDAEIELVEDDKATGRLIAAQIKCGDSYFGERTETHIVYRFGSDHFRYWRDHALPVVVILVDHNAEKCFWQKVDADEAISTGKNYRLNVPTEQVLDATALAALINLATPRIEENQFAITSQVDEKFGSVTMTNFVVTLSERPVGWVKHEIEQIVRQVTAETRVKLERAERDDLLYKSGSRILSVSVSTLPTPTTPSRAIAKAECTFLDDGSVEKTFWNWRFEWSGEYFLSGETKKLSDAAMQYVARNSGRLFTAKSYLDWCDIQIKFYYGVYGRWESARWTSILDEWNDMPSPPHECEAMHAHILEMLSFVRECKALVDTEDPKTDWRALTHRKAGHGFLQKAHEAAIRANSELLTLSRRA